MPSLLEDFPELKQKPNLSVLSDFPELQQQGKSVISDFPEPAQQQKESLLTDFPELQGGQIAKAKQPTAPVEAPGLPSSHEPTIESPELFPSHAPTRPPIDNLPVTAMQPESLPDKPKPPITTEDILQHGYKVMRDIGLDMYTPGGAERRINYLRNRTPDQAIEDMSDMAARGLSFLFVTEGIGALVGGYQIARSQFSDLSPTLRMAKRVVNKIGQQIKLNRGDEKIITDILENPTNYTQNELAQLARKRPNIKQFLLKQRSTPEPAVLEPQAGPLPSIGQPPALIKKIPSGEITNTRQRLEVFGSDAFIGGDSSKISGIGETATSKKIMELNNKVSKANDIESKIEPIKSNQLNQEYEGFKDAWFGEKDWQAEKASIDSALLQDKIKDTTGEKRFKNLSKDIDKAIQIYIDTKRNPEHLSTYYDQLSPEQKRIVDLSQNLTPEQQSVADEISRQYDDLGLQALDADVIHNVLDNYVGRIWDVAPPKKSSEQFRKFGTNTRHAKARTFQTIIEGMAKGYNLKIEGATNNLAILKEEIHNTIQDKKFLDQLTKMKDLDGNAILSKKQLPGYVRVEHPNFKVWRYAGTAEATEEAIRGKNFIQTPEGTLLERQELYAPKYLAKDLNNIMGVSKLKGIPWIDAITKYNAVTKSWLLQTSLFHHLAFMRSYYLGSAPFGEAIQKIKSGEGFIEAIKELTPRQSYKAGLDAIKNMQPEIELLVRNGLTLGRIQDWEEHLVRQEDTFVGRTLDKMKVTKDIKDKIEAFREKQADFLFKQLGAGLKAKAALIELRSILKKHPGIDPNKAAKIAANLVNDDFGGLHLKRLGRNPTTQHVFRLFALAPDWTESNLRSMRNAFKRGEEGEVYRRFWARIITKAAFATLAANALLHGDELPESYAKGWKAGKLRWMDVDITPIYKAFGGDTKARKYFSIIGHFHDPLKFAVDPVKAAHYKGSVVYRTLYEAISGEDWAGREFTELPELMETGATVRPKFTFAGKPSKYSQAPSYLISQAKGIQPIQVQQLINWWMGETEAFDAIGQALGLGIRTTYEPTPEQKRKEKAIRRTIKMMNRKRK